MLAAIFGSVLLENQMPIPVTCSGCGTVARAADAAVGKRVRCRKCGSVMQVPSTASGDEMPITNPLAAAVPPTVPTDTFAASADEGQTLAEQIRLKRQVEEAGRKRKYALRVKLPIVAAGMVAAIYFLAVAENERSWGLFVLAATAMGGLVVCLEYLRLTRIIVGGGGVDPRSRMSRDMTPQELARERSVLTGVLAAALAVALIADMVMRQPFWVNAIVGVLALVFIVFAFTSLRYIHELKRDHQCPHCGTLWSKVRVGSESLGETRVASTVSKQRVNVQHDYRTIATFDAPVTHVHSEQKVVRYYCCSACGEQWSHEGWTRQQ